MHHFRLVMHHTCRKSPPSPCFQALSRFLDQLYAYTKSLFFATIMYIPGSLGTSLKQSSVWKASSMHQTFDSTIVFSIYPVRNCNILFILNYHLHFDNSISRVSSSDISTSRDLVPLVAPTTPTNSS